MFRTIAIVFIFLLSINSYGQNRTLDSLIALTKNHIEDTALVSLKINIAETYRVKGDNERSISWTDTSMVLAKKIHDRKGEARANHQYGVIYLYSYEYEKASKYLNQGLTIRQEDHDLKGIAKSFFALSLCELMQNHYEAGEAYALKSISFSKQVNDSAMLAKGLNTLAASNFRMGKFQKAMEYWMEDEKISEALHDSTTLASIKGNIGSVYTELGNIPEAIRYHRMALEKKLHNRQIKDLPSVYLSLGRCYQHLHQLDSAMFYYHLGLPLSIAANNRKTTSVFYNNISAIHVLRSNFDSAMYFNKLSLRENEVAKDTLEIADSYIHEGEIYAFMGQKQHRFDYYNKAITSYEESLRLSRIINARITMNKALMGLSDVYAEQKRFDKAYFYLDNYTRSNDSLRDTTFTQQIAEMQAKYETEKKQAEINQLNSEREISAVKLARQHALNYSLFIIAFLILLSSVLIYRNIQKKSRAEKQVAILEKQNAIESMRSKIAGDVHDDMGAGLTKMGLFSEQLLKSTTMTEKEKNLLEKISLQSKEAIDGMREIIWSSNPANDNLKSMLGFMRQYIDRFFDGTEIRPVVTFPNQVGEIPLHPEVRRNLFLILKESLNNAVKYSGSDKVDIDFDNQNENFNFSVKDYGKGIDDKPKNEFNNGMNNMRLRAQQIESEFNLITSPGNGVHIFIEGKLY